MLILLVLSTLVVVALALALAPGRWRRSPRPARPAMRRSEVLGVCGRCAEIVEIHDHVELCPACGSRLVVRQRIVDHERPRARAGT